MYSLFYYIYFLSYFDYILSDYRNIIISVFYIFNKTIFLIKLIIFNIIRLNLACFNKDICFYINVFFLRTYFLLT